MNETIVKKAKRLCDSDVCKGRDCPIWYLRLHRDGEPSNCVVSYIANDSEANKQIKTLEDWAEANPRTCKDVLMDALTERFPNANIRKDGALKLCPTQINANAKRYCDLHQRPDCSFNMCDDCWNQPYEESGADE